MNSTQIEYFIKIKETKSFSKVAKLYYTSPIAISKQISNLEKELGMKLLVRTYNGISYSSKGEEFYNCCIEMKKTFDQFKEKNTEAAKFTLAVDFYDNAKIFFLLNNTHHGKPNINYYEGHFDSFNELLNEGKIDGYFIVDTKIPSLNSDFEITPICPIQVYGCINTNHELATRKSLSIEELQKYHLCAHNEKFYNLNCQQITYSPLDVVNYINEGSVVITSSIDNLFEVPDYKFIPINCTSNLCLIHKKEGYHSSVISFFREHIRKIEEKNYDTK